MSDFREGNTASLQTASGSQLQDIFLQDELHGESDGSEDGTQHGSECDWRA